MTWLSAVTLLNLYAEHIIRNAGLDEIQTGIKIGKRNINNLRYCSNGRKQREIQKTLDEGEGGQ